MVKDAPAPKKDILGQRKQFVKGLKNDWIYAGLAALGLYGWSQGWFNQFLAGGSPSAPVTVSANPNPDPEGTPVTATGKFDPAVNTAYWGVKNAQGQLVS